MRLLLYIGTLTLSWALTRAPCLHNSMTTLLLPLSEWTIRGVQPSYQNVANQHQQWHWYYDQKSLTVKFGARKKSQQHTTCIAFFPSLLSGTLLYSFSYPSSPHPCPQVPLSPLSSHFLSSLTGTTDCPPRLPSFPSAQIIYSLTPRCESIFAPFCTSFLTSSTFLHRKRPCVYQDDKITNEHLRYEYHYIQYQAELLIANITESLDDAVLSEQCLSIIVQLLKCHKLEIHLPTQVYLSKTFIYHREEFWSSLFSSFPPSSLLSLV